LPILVTRRTSPGLNWSPVTSSLFAIDLNLISLKGIIPLPMRSCVKKGEPLESTRIRMHVNKNSGAKKIRAVIENIRSNNLLICGLYANN